MISTHSPVMLELSWAMKYIKKYNGTAKDVINLFQIKEDSSIKGVFDSAITKSFKTYYFDRQKDGVRIKDISTLDAGSEDNALANWGGLSEFASRAGDIVSRLVAHGEEK